MERIDSSIADGIEAAATTMTSFLVRLALACVAVLAAACASPPPLQPMSEEEIKSFYGKEQKVKWRTDDGEVGGYTTFRPDGTITQSGVIGTGDPLWGKYGGKTTQKYNIPSLADDGTYTVLENGYCVRFTSRKQQDCFQLFKRGHNAYASVSPSEDGRGIVLREFSVDGD